MRNPSDQPVRGGAATGAPRPFHLKSSCPFKGRSGLRGAAAPSPPPCRGRCRPAFGSGGGGRGRGLGGAERSGPDRSGPSSGGPPGPALSASAEGTPPTPLFPFVPPGARDTTCPQKLPAGPPRRCGDGAASWQCYGGCPTAPPLPPFRTLPRSDGRALPAVPADGLAGGSAAGLSSPARVPVPAGALVCVSAGDRSLTAMSRSSLRTALKENVRKSWVAPSLPRDQHYMLPGDEPLFELSNELNCLSLVVRNVIRLIFAPEPK